MKHFSKDHNSAISLVEMTIIFSVLGIIGGAAILGLTNINQVAKETKLSGDVKTLNSAINAYILSGGDLRGTTDPRVVIEMLKSSLTGDDRRAHIGIGGATVDPRLSIRTSSQTGSLSADSSREFAAWNRDTMRFEIRDGSDPNGILEFFLDDNLVASTPTESSRSLPFEYNRSKGWVWNFEESAPASRLPPTPVVVSTPPEDTIFPPVPPVNIAPVALPDFANTTNQTPVSIEILSNDSDANGDPLSIVSLSAPANGMVRQFGDSVLYVPNSNFVGDDAFPYSITDGNGAYSSSVVTILVDRENRPPVAVADFASPEEPVNILPLDGTFEDLASVATSASPNSNVTGGGWKNGEETADTWIGPIADGNYIAGGAKASPNGGVFAGSVVWGPGRREAFYTDIENLVPGNTYEVSFYQANGGNIAAWQAPRSPHTLIGDTVRWAIQFGDQQKFSTPVAFTGFGSQAWVHDSVQFTATRATQRLEFWSDTVEPFVVYETGLIDDIRVTASVPPIFRDIDLLANDTDPDGDALSVLEINGTPVFVGSIIPISASARIILQSNGLISIRGEVAETTTFTYTITDGADTDESTVTLSP